MGVQVDGGASGNIIGDRGDGEKLGVERNILGGNAAANVSLSGVGTDGNVVAGDFIGADVTGQVIRGRQSL